MRRLSIAAALVLMTATIATGQIAGGAVAGSVRDEQGGVLPDTTVALTGSDRTSTTRTDEAGRFRFLNLAPGPYDLVATRSGFNETARAGVEVRVGVTSDLAMTLTVAGVQEAVTVGGSLPIVDMRTTGTATNFTLRDLDAVPSSRDTFSLLRMVPGVLLDRVNIAGNETGQQSNVQSKGTRSMDVVWTLDGVVVTDMASVGAAPVYFNYDNFEEVHVTTAGQDIRQPTGGLGINLVVRRGTNDFHGLVRGYLTNDALEAENVPHELRQLGVTGKTADHNQQILDYGFDLGGPILRDRLWFHGSYSYQDVRLIRTQLVDRTAIKNPNLKISWQATRNDLVSFLYFDGDKVKNGRVPSGSASILFPAPTALQNQHNAYADTPFHGLWKIEDNHTFGSRMFTTAKLAYFNAGFELEPAGGLAMSSGRSTPLSRSFGSVFRGRNLRPQWTTNVDANLFEVTGAASHDVRFGFGWRRVDAQSGTVWPGNGFLALDNSPADQRVRIFREGRGTNRAESLSFYVGDTVQFSRITLDAGVRVDRQTGAALPSQTAGNPVFPTLVPGISFAGVELPFDWTNVSPRAGVTYAIDESRRTIGRFSISRYAGQMPTGLPGFLNPSSTVGFVEYRWNDLDGDNLATADEVRLDQFIQSGGGFNPADPTAVTSSFQLDAGMKAPVTTSVVAGVDRELAAGVGVQAHYTYTRTAKHFGTVARRVGVTRSDYAPGPPLVGTLPEGIAYNIPTWTPSIAAVIAGGGGFIMGNWDGYTTDYSGVEVALVRRHSGRWMGRVAGSWNQALEHYAPESRYNFIGNPTRTDTEPMVDGGQFAPTTGDVFINAKWQVTAAGAYLLPRDIEVGVSIFGRQGYPFVPFRAVPLGVDFARVLVTPEIDTLRLDNLWNTDLRISKSFETRGATIQLVGDIFNVLNANTELVRNRNAAAPNYRALAQNLSPRILRLGLRVGF